ncbi:MAG: ATP-dependent Clp protease ATP-binding subunit, partial [Ruminococcaceae bacterium]|nr:ATP-dependent Clp protease ATP-binding subunit [Oscillospiraceae bacterium]
NRRQKNNPCLIGEPGVGKTAIVEGIAQQLADGSAPPRLADKQLYLLDLTGLVAGTQFRGQFESRVKGLIEEVKAIGNIILVIDEVHTLVGTGDAEGSMNAANMLKPALSRGEIQVIGATTLNEYRKYIEKDAALERRFQPVMVNEPSVEETVEMLRGIKTYYEKFHNISVPMLIAERAVEMSERYVNDRFLPDKAIDLIDEACSNAVLKNPLYDEFFKLGERLKTVKEEAEALEAKEEKDESDYQKIAEARSEELRLKASYDELSSKVTACTVTFDDLAAVIELWTGIPASKIKEGEYAKLRNLESELKKHIVGQDVAVEAVANAVKRGRISLVPRKRPVSFIFSGPTGVGKTELVKVLSAELFDSPETLIRLDMSEFMEKHAVSRIIGSPPGYVGYDEAGQLTEKIRRKPYSVILFDEIEKAHPDVLNILLQILDDGILTDSHGRKVSFEHALIVMTTNAGSNVRGGEVGFNKSVATVSAEKTKKALREFLRPEFLNRVDEIITFNPLEKDLFEDIVKIRLEELRAGLVEREIEFSYEKEVLSVLADMSYSSEYGARNVRRVVQKEIEDKVVSVMCESDMIPKKISVFADDSKLRVEVE